MDANAVSLAGEIAGAEPLRHTPAGLPLLAFKLTHKSQQIEAGYRRQVECEVSCIAMGDAATRLAKLGTGAAVKVTGFLNRKNRMSAQLVLHATSTEILKEADHGNDEQGRPGTGKGQSKA